MPFGQRTEKKDASWWLSVRVRVRLQHLRNHGAHFCGEGGIDIHRERAWLLLVCFVAAGREASRHPPYPMNFFQNRGIHFNWCCHSALWPVIHSFPLTKGNLHHKQMETNRWRTHQVSRCANTPLSQGVLQNRVRLGNPARKMQKHERAWMKKNGLSMPLLKLCHTCRRQRKQVQTKNESTPGERPDI